MLLSLWGVVVINVIYMTIADSKRESKNEDWGGGGKDERQKWLRSNAGSGPLHLLDKQRKDKAGKGNAREPHRSRPTSMQERQPCLLLL